MVVAFICFFLPFIKYDYDSPYLQYKYSISTYQMLDAMDDIRVLIIVLIISLFADIILVYLAFTSKNQKLGQWMVISGILGIILVITSRVMVGKILNIFESFEIFDYEINIPEIKFSTGFGFWGMLIGFFVFAFAGYMWRSSTDWKVRKRLKLNKKFVQEFILYSPI